MRAKLATLNHCAVPFKAAQPPTCAGTTIDLIKHCFSLSSCNYLDSISGISEIIRIPTLTEVNASCG